MDDTLITALSALVLMEIYKLLRRDLDSADKVTKPKRRKRRRPPPKPS
jgi:hypothetical protein